MSGFTYAFSPIITQLNTFFVSPLGLDAAERGSQSYPFKTIQYAVNYIESLPTPPFQYVLLIENGVYFETVTVSGSIFIGSTSGIPSSVFIDLINFADGSNVIIHNVQMNATSTFGSAIVQYQNCLCEANLYCYGTGTVRVFGGDFNSNNTCITIITGATTIEMGYGCTVGQFATLAAGSIIYLHNNEYVRYLEVDVAGQFILENNTVVLDETAYDYAFVASASAGGHVYFRGNVSFVKSNGSLAPILIDETVPFQFDRVLYDIENSSILGTPLNPLHSFDCTKNTLPNANAFTANANNDNYSTAYDDYFIVFNTQSFTGCTVTLDKTIVDRRRLEIFNAGSQPLSLISNTTNVGSVPAGSRRVITYLTATTTWYIS